MFALHTGIWLLMLPMLGCIGGYIACDFTGKAARVNVLQAQVLLMVCNEPEGESFTAGAANAWFGSPFCAELAQVTAHPGSSMFYNSIP